MQNVENWCASLIRRRICLPRGLTAGLWPTGQWVGAQEETSRSRAAVIFQKTPGAFINYCKKVSPMAAPDCLLYLRLGTHKAVSLQSNSPPVRILSLLSHSRSIRGEGGGGGAARRSAADAMDDPRRRLPGEAAPTYGKSHPSSFLFIPILYSSSMRMRRVGFACSFALLDPHLSSMVCVMCMWTVADQIWVH